MKINFWLTLLMLISVRLAFGQIDAPKYSNEFLSIGVGAEALGMSNSVVAGVDNVTAGYWNPAGLVYLDNKMEVSFMHSEYFAGIAKYDYLGWAMKIDSQSTLGVTAIRFGVDNIPNTTQLIDNAGNIDYDRITTFSAADYGFLFSYARKLSVKGLSTGGNFKIVYRQVGDFAKSWGFGIDAGMQYKMSDRWKFGAILRDASSTFNAWIFDLDDATKEVFQTTGNEIPTNGLELTLPKLIMGAQGTFNLGENFYTRSEIDFDFTFDGRRNVLVRTSPISIDPHLGVEFGFKTYVAIRAGIGNFQYIKNVDNTESISFQPNVGLGVSFKGVTLNYAFTDIGDQSVALYSHVFSIRLNFDVPKNTE